jgi:parallel beta-helix repeat protein
MISTFKEWKNDLMIRNVVKLSFGLLFKNILFLLLTFYLPVTFAQPSGGPYGPIQKNYDLPKVSGEIYYVAVNGKADQSGESINNPTTIESAIERVKTDDAIILRGGTYRTGNLILNQGITIQPYKDEQPVLKGTLIAKDWKKQENGLWVTEWEHLFPSKPQDWWRRYRHGSDVPQHRFNNDMVFVDGRFLQSVGWEGELDENSYYINYETKYVYLSFDPREHEIEITAFDIGLLRTTGKIHNKISDGKGPIIRGITFSQYASRAIDVQGYYPTKLSKDSEHGKDVVGTVLENCTISYSAQVGGNFIGDSLIIRNCKISDTSTEGIYIVASSDVLIEKNIFKRNNIEHLQGYYPAAVKIFNQCYRVTCKNNLITDQQNSIGVWYDVGNVDGVFINNWLENIHYNETHRKPNDVYPIGSGFYFEISRRAICAGNVFVDCDAGIHIRNSADVEMYQNTLINSQVLIDRTERTTTGDHFDWHPSTGPGINERDGHVFENNLIVADKNFKEPLLYVWQPDTLCNLLDKPMLKQLDHNVYVRTNGNTANPLILWSPASDSNCQAKIESVDSLHILNPEFAASSHYYKNYNGPLFKSMELGNYQILSDFAGNKFGTKLPEKISEFIGQTEIRISFIGAFPPIK